MTGISSAIFAGRVVHKRLSPKRHAFAYKVVSLYLDVLIRPLVKPPVDAELA